ncbi:ATP-binding protein [Vulgatibacter incomptus]|uniref:Flagellar sensor histidine kinase FleS n=1 Tax=Vulgatibacter incomptus TaxID=1391653 RepID=A0A0K1PCZ2_9BACT|nr:ATP-binding protein [Vulgatibacter incomptus]AKU91390.1 Flagellar sensor histidine kinase FleS [Vulgatibacter incomptus]
MRKSNARIRIAPRLTDAALAAARPLAGVSHAATLAWDRRLVIRSAAGASLLVLGSPPAELKKRPLSELFEKTQGLADALSFGTSRQMELRTGQRVRVEAGPCPGGAVAVIRRSTTDELELGHLASALGHELRNGFASVRLAIQSLARHEEVASERGRRRLLLAERELRRIDCVLRGLQEMGSHAPLRPLEAVPEKLIADALGNLGPFDNDRIQMAIPEEEGPPAQLDAPRVGLAIEEMLRHGVRSVANGGALTVSVERAPGELSVILRGTGLPGSDLGHPDTRPDLGIAVIQGVARAHGGHLKIEAGDLDCQLTLVLPQRPVLP